MLKKLSIFLALFFIIGGISFAEWDDGITEPWEQDSLVAYPVAMQSAFSFNYTGSTSTSTDVTISSLGYGVPLCLAAFDTTSVVSDPTNFSIAATITFDNTDADEDDVKEHLAELGLCARVSAGMDPWNNTVVNGYVLGMNPYNNYLAILEINATQPGDLDDAVQIAGFDPTLDYNMKLVVNGNQLDGYLYDATGTTELGHVSITDTESLQQGTGAGAYIWNSAADQNDVAPNGTWSDARITAAVPEPGTIALLCTGLLALAGFAYRRRG